MPIDDTDRCSSFLQMGGTSTGTWDAVRDLFAEQFERDGVNFIYRKSKKGEAILVSADERDRFVDAFNGQLRRCTWIIVGGVLLVTAAAILFASTTNRDLSKAAIFTGVGFVVVAYLLYYKWIWAAPVRELGSRTPVAGALSRDEVRRMTLGKVRYGNLAFGALAALALPFLASGHGNPFSGWNRLWLLFGGGLMLLVAVQAFRKWRFDQEEGHGAISLTAAERSLQEATFEPITRFTSKPWRFLPLALLIGGGAFIAYTAAGKRVAQSPSFFPILMIGVGGWALFSVFQGLRKGEIEPFARGFYNTYERGSQPKRYWASVVWNAVFSILCFWLALMLVP